MAQMGDPALGAQAESLDNSPASRSRTFIALQYVISVNRWSAID